MLGFEKENVESGRALEADKRRDLRRCDNMHLTGKVGVCVQRTQ
jgi:hypothetical protein